MCYNRVRNTVESHLFKHTGTKGCSDKSNNTICIQSSFYLMHTKISMNIIQEVFLLLFHLSSSNQANADPLDVSKCCTCVTHSSLNVYFHGIALFA